MTSTGKSRKTCILLVTSGLLVVILGLVLLMSLPWVIIKKDYETTTESGKMKPVYTTRLFPLDGHYVQTVSMEILSSAQTSQFVSLNVYSKPPPLDTPNDVTVYVKYVANNHYQVACEQFYLNPGSVMNVTFCADDRTRWLVIRGQDEISDYGNIKPPHRVLFNRTFSTVRCESGASSGTVFAYDVTTPDLYRFCFETFKFVYVTDIQFSGVSMQYNVSGIRGSKCVPSSDEHFTCVLDVPDESSAVAIVELTDAASDFPDVQFNIQTSVRVGFVWKFTGPGIAATAVLVLLGSALALYIYMKKKMARALSREQLLEPGNEENEAE